jgi:hypothetical protein
MKVHMEDTKCLDKLHCPALQNLIFTDAKNPVVEKSRVRNNIFLRHPDVEGEDLDYLNDLYDHDNNDKMDEVEMTTVTTTLSTVRNQPELTNVQAAWSLLDRTPGLLTLHLPVVARNGEFKARLFDYLASCQSRNSTPRDTPTHTSSSSVNNGIMSNIIISTSLPSWETQRSLAHLSLQLRHVAGRDMVTMIQHLPESLLSIEFRIATTSQTPFNEVGARINISEFIRYRPTSLALKPHQENDNNNNPHTKPAKYPLRLLSLTRIQIWSMFCDFGGREV